MYAKSFIALDGNGRLTGARTAQAAPYANYTCHLCGSALRYHPQYDTELPWFEHTDDRLTEHGAYSALFDHGLASKSDQRFASIRSTGNLTFSTAF